MAPVEKDVRLFLNDPARVDQQSPDPRIGREIIGRAFLFVFARSPGDN